MKAADVKLAHRANLYAFTAEAEIPDLTIAQSRAVRETVARAFVVGYAAKLEDDGGVEQQRTVRA